MNTNKPSCCVIGLGYIGLPTAAVLASHGIRVFGADVNSNVVDTINQGQVHIVEPDLDAVVQQAVRVGMLTAHSRPQKADVFVIAVPTPFHADKTPDLSYIRSAANSLAPELCKGNLVILESTSPVGTTEQLAQWLQEARVDLTFPSAAVENPDVHIAYCPERVLPGKVLHELIYNDRVVGGMTAQCSAKAASLYKTFLKADCHVTNSRTSEMAKLTENAFRDVNIAFANELSMICTKNEINVWELIRLANRHPRVNILEPGPGVGGHCIAVDPWFIVARNPKEAKLIRAARETNDAKPEFVIQRTLKVLADCSASSLAIMGITYKPDIDDLRESPSLDIARELCHRFEGRVDIVEPNIHELPVQLQKYSNCNLSTIEKASLDCDALLILVNHREFKELDFHEFQNKAILDTKGVVPQTMVLPV